MHLLWLSAFVITAARPTSEPVPAVVGTATTGQDARGARAQPVVADVLEIPEWARLAGQERDRLAGIEAAAAAERDHAVVAACAQRLDAPHDVGPGRVRPDGREQAAGEPGIAGDLQQPVPERVFGETGVGDQQRARDPERPAGVRQLHDPPRPEAYLGRIAPVAAERLGIDDGGGIDRAHDASGSGW